MLCSRHLYRYNIGVRIIRGACLRQLSIASQTKHRELAMILCNRCRVRTRCICRSSLLGALVGERHRAEGDRELATAIILKILLVQILYSA